jgi:DNA (cytosine-5)-methyltransferase 1
MRVLDLFCGAGCAADGYAEAGYEPHGVDWRPQLDYPYHFTRMDAMEVLSDPQVLWQYDLIHASPPCQLFTRARHLREAQGSSTAAIDLLTPTIHALRRLSRRPWVVENVEAAAPLMQPERGEYLVRLCGSAYGLDVQRHRMFLSNRPIVGTPCFHDRFPIDLDSGKPRPWGVYHVPGDSIPKGGRTARDAEHAMELFGMSRPLPWNSIKEGFPPAYTAHLGHQLRYMR